MKLFLLSELTQCPPFVAAELDSSALKTMAASPYVLFAAIAAFEFLKMLKLGPLGVVIGSIIWVGIVIAAERFTLTIANDPRPIKNWLRAAPRIALACLMSFLVTDTIVVRLFEDAIKVELEKSADKVAAEAAAQRKLQLDERMGELESEKRISRERLDELFFNRKAAEESMHAEADGTGGTRIEGEGYHYRRRKEAYERAAAEYERERVVLEGLIANYDAELALLRQEVQDVQKNRRAIAGDVSDLGSRREALAAVLNSKPNARLTYWVVYLLLMFAELFVLSNKLIGRKDEYDTRVQNQSDVRELELAEEFKLSRLNTKALAFVKAGIARRVFGGFRDAEKSSLSDAEKRMRERIVDQALRDIADCVLPNKEDRDARPLSVPIRVEIIGHPEREAILRLTEDEVGSATLDDVADELSELATSLTRPGELPMRFQRAENSLGLVIWPDSPLFTQLEADRVLRVRFETPGVEIGLE